MNKLKIFVTVVVALAVGMVAAFYLCANDIYNPFHSLFEKGSGHGVGSTDIHFEQKDIQVAPVRVETIRGVDLTETQTESLNRSQRDDVIRNRTGGVVTIPLSPCPTFIPYAINDTIPWRIADIVKLPNDSSVLWNDSGSYFLKAIIDPEFRTVRDLEFYSTPIHPVYYSTTNRVIITPEKAIDYYAGVANKINANTFGLSIGATFPSELLPIIHPKNLTLDFNADYFFNNSFAAVLHLYYHFK